MAFLVEDGTGIADANAYVSVAFADGYHADRGQDNWVTLGTTTAKKQAAIIRATEHVDKRFGPVFRGVRQSKGQGLEWPRLSSFDNDEFSLDSQVPAQLKKAVAEYALRALMLGELNPDPPSPTAKQDHSDVNTVGSSRRGEPPLLSALREKVGPIETETRYASTPQLDFGLVSSGLLPSYPAADMWLTELIRNRNSRATRRA